MSAADNPEHFADWAQLLGELAPYRWVMSYIREVPELSLVFREAVVNEWTKEQFREAVMQSDWYRRGKR